MLGIVVARSDEVFVDGLGFFSTAVGRLEEAAWQRPSPCSDWRAMDVLGHVGQAVRFGTSLLVGDAPVWEPAEPLGAVVEGDSATWWAGLAGPARQAVSGVDLAQVVDSPMGRRSIEEGLAFPALDLFVHAWDLARSVGEVIEIPPEVIDFAHRVLDPVPPEQLRSPRVFAEALPPPTGATATETFIAWTGRDPLWRPAS